MGNHLDPANKNIKVVFSITNFLKQFSNGLKEPSREFEKYKAGIIKSIARSTKKNKNKKQKRL